MVRSELAVAATAGLELAVNQWLALDPQALARFAPCFGKVIAVELQGTGLTLYCLPAPTGMTLMTQYQGQADTTLSGRPFALFKLATGDSARVMLDGEVVIRGNVEIGQAFKRAMDRMDIDWEEHVSHITGDVIAHKAGHLIREFGQWWSNSSQRFASNLRDYVQDEMQMNPTPTEAERFYHDIETLRDDIARLSARIELVRKSTNAK
jgi:ubiquinone biosynthesis protein UbiJ